MNLSYTVQWSYDKKQWYGYGVGNEIPVVFVTLGGAREVFSRLVSTYYAVYYRVVDNTGAVVLEDTSLKHGYAHSGAN